MDLVFPQPRAGIVFGLIILVVLGLLTLVGVANGSSGGMNLGRVTVGISIIVFLVVTVIWSRLGRRKGE